MYLYYPNPLFFSSRVF